MKSFLKLIVITTLCLYSFKGYTWNALGHLVIANIAYAQLKPEVRVKVDKIAHDLGVEYPDIIDFTHLAPWPDAIKSQKIEMYTHWHYINLPFSDDGTPLKNIMDTDNAVWAIDTLAPVVSNSKANPCDRARSLAFLVHVVGDLHQPLHTVARISATNPEGDQGGNLYFVKYPNAKKQTITLHKYWDQGIDIFTINSTAENITFLTNTIVTHYPVEFFGTKVNELKSDGWAQEGLNIASSFVYSTPENEIPNAMYVETGRKIVEQRIALSGYRLANVLNKLLA